MFKMTAKALVLALILGLSSVAALASIPTLHEFSANANCDSATVSWAHYGSDSAQITVTSSNGTQNFTAGANGTLAVDFDSTLAAGSTVTVSVEVYSAYYALDGYNFAVLPVSCDGSDTSNIETSGSVLCNDGRLNTNLCEPIAIYPVAEDEGFGIAVYEILRADSSGQWELQVTAKDRNNLPATTVECVIERGMNDFSFVTLLPDGTLRVYAGPDFESKVFIFSFVDFPSTPSYATYYGAKPELANC